MEQLVTGLQYLSILAFCFAVVHAAFSDMFSLQIPNADSIIIFIVFLPAALISGMPIISIAAHYGIALLVFCVGVVIYANGITGAGDVKFLSAICVWWELHQLGKYLILVALLGGILGAIILLARRFQNVRRLLPWMADSTSMTQPVPYGIAIAGAVPFMFGTLSILPSSLSDLIR